MKNIFMRYLAVVACLVMTSCLSDQKIIVSGVPGTKIYTPDLTELGELRSDGKAKIGVDVFTYTPYLLSQQPNTNCYIPFALDYKKRHGDRCRVFLGCFTLFLPCIGMPFYTADQYGTFKYISSPTTNEDFPFVPFVDEGIIKTMNGQKPMQK